jgi:hypothetical protein
MFASIHLRTRAFMRCKTLERFQFNVGWIHGNGLQYG